MDASAPNAHYKSPISKERLEKYAPAKRLSCLMS
jgi:hypothetical protein